MNIKEKEFFEKFRNENIAVNCETKEEAAAFVKKCYSENILWNGSDPYNTYFNEYKDKTCYTFNFRTHHYYLEYSEKDFYEKRGWTIVKYKDIIKEEKKMTNLEYVASKDLTDEDVKLCMIAHVCKYGSGCTTKSCINCEFSNNINLCVKTLLEEHKEKTKLKHWERAIIKAELRNIGNYQFSWFDSLVEMKKDGYFNGIKDVNMTLEEILNNCEVIEDE